MWKLILSVYSATESVRVEIKLLLRYKFSFIITEKAIKAMSVCPRFVSCFKVLHAISRNKFVIVIAWIPTACDFQGNGPVKVLV